VFEEFFWEPSGSLKIFLYLAKAWLLHALFLAMYFAEAEYFLGSKSKNYPQNTLVREEGPWAPICLKGYTSWASSYDEGSFYVVVLFWEPIETPVFMVAASWFLLNALMPVFSVGKGLAVIALGVNVGFVF